MEMNPSELSHHRSKWLGHRESIGQSPKQRAVTGKVSFQALAHAKRDSGDRESERSSTIGCMGNGADHLFQKRGGSALGALRLCSLDPSLEGYFHNDRFSEQFEIYADLESAMAGKRS